MLRVCTHPPFRPLDFPSVYAGPSAMTCVSTAHLLAFRDVRKWKRAIPSGWLQSRSAAGNVEDTLGHRGVLEENGKEFTRYMLHPEAKSLSPDERPAKPTPGAYSGERTS